MLSEPCRSCQGEGYENLCDSTVPVLANQTNDPKASVYHTIILRRKGSRKWGMECAATPDKNWLQDLVVETVSVRLTNGSAV